VKVCDKIHTVNTKGFFFSNLAIKMK
jgi:hypothetical protein